MNFSDLFNRDSFIRSVRRASVTLRDTGLISNEDILDIAINESYPRIALILVSTKAKDGNNDKPILGGLGPNSNYMDQMREVQRLLESSIYAEGINRVAISLTAATCIKQIPLNSDVQLFDLAKNLEDQAISDLDRIMGLISETGIVTAEDESNSLEANSGEPKIYISSSLDLSTIKEEDFDLVVRDTAKTNSVRLANVSIPPGKVGLCWIGLTGTMLSGSVETGFFIQDGDSTESITESVSMSINELSSEGSSSVIASPNRGSLLTTSLSYKKKELYPSSTKNRDKALYFEIEPRIHSISFSSRTLSTVFNKELVNIKFYTLPDTSSPLSSYLSRRFSKECEPIPGLVYGVIPQYKLLNDRGPHSLLMEVDKQAAAADLNNRLDTIDTFYFRIKSDIPAFSTEITVRSSSPLIEGFTDWTVDIGPEDTQESIAFKVLNGFYRNHEQCLLVGGMPQANAVQMIPYSKSKYETRVVADILNVPSYLEVATGSAMVPLTQYRAEPRSVVVKIVPDQTSHLNDDSTAPYGASSTSYRSLSKPMQNVYDRIDLLRKSREDLYRGRPYA